MDELTVKHERLARVATAVVVAIVWALCAFVTFTASEAGDTVFSMTDQGGTSGTLDVIPCECSTHRWRWPVAPSRSAPNRGVYCRIRAA
jgi:hypothetical protein